MATDWVGFAKPVEVEGKSKDALWREEGIGRGGCLGLVAGMLYLPVLLSVVGLLTLPTRLASTTPQAVTSSSNSGTWDDAFFGFFFILLCLFVAGGLPSAVIGAVTGGLLASRMERISSATGRQVTFAGLRIGFVVLLAVHALYLLLWHNFTPVYWQGYLFVLGIPSPIFLCLAVAVAHKTRPRGDLTGRS